MVWGSDLTNFDVIFIFSERAAFCMVLVDPFILLLYNFSVNIFLHLPFSLSLKKM